MSDPLTDAHHDWILAVCGIDPRSYPNKASHSATPSAPVAPRNAMPPASVAAPNEPSGGTDKTKDEQEGVLSEVVKGDFHAGPTTWTGTLLNVGIGLIPGVGQVADARDTAAAAKNLWTEPSWGNAGVLGLAVAGWIPGIGDAVKGGVKVGRNLTKDVAKEALERSTNELPEKTTLAGKLADKTVHRADKAATDSVESATKKATLNSTETASHSAAPGPGETMIKEEKRSGLNVDLAGQEHRHKTDYRKGSGTDAQSAHMVNSSSVKDISDYVRDRALTVLLPADKHKAFDNYWKKWAKAKLAAAKPGEEVMVTVQEWERVLNDAADSALKGRTADTMSFMIRTEIYQTLGLDANQLIRVPFSKK
jgi:hypothetical protein